MIVLMARKGINRRDALKIGGLGSLAALTGFGCDSKPTPPPKTAKDDAEARPRLIGRKPRNVIMMVSDGMTVGVPTLAQELAVRTRGRDTTWYQLLQNPDATQGLSQTQSLNSLVTDSAAAASAWGSGSRVNNGTLNVLPDGTQLVPIATLLTNNGQRVGLVTTDDMCGATPSGFATVSPSRHDYASIAKQYQGAADVVFGGGRLFFDPLAREDQLDLIGLFQQQGYDFVTNRDAILGRPSAGSARTLGLFTERRMPFTIDHLHDDELRRNVPTLAEMTRYALRTLSTSPDGFFIMIEGARIDHAGHANDAAAMLWDQVAFDDAIAEALAFVENRDDTLLLITSDHGTGNPGLNGMGSAYSESTQHFEKLLEAKGSYSKFKQTAEQRRGKDSVDAIRSSIRDIMQVDVSKDEAKVLADALFENKSAQEIWKQDRSWVAVLGRILANHNGMTFTGTSHTADHVILTALGPGQENFAGLHPHTHIFKTVTAFFDIDYVNPTAST